MVQTLESRVRRDVASGLAPTTNPYRKAYPQPSGRVPEPDAAALVRQSDRVAGVKGGAASGMAGRLGCLPAPPTPLVGRQREAGEARLLLCRPDVRLVTFFGPAGAGKTRLALEVAAQLRNEFGDGVTFLDLAPVRTVEQVSAALAASLSLDTLAAPHAPPFSRSYGASRDRQRLLVLDTFEHLLPAASQLAELLEACPHVKLIVTSRAILQLRWERVFPVPPLGLPPSNRLCGTEEAAGCPAVELFVQRAQAVRPSFALTPSNARDVAEICSRLDGLPLAIELAASSSVVLSPQAIVAQLDRGIELAATGAVDLPLRQQSLDTAIGWSYHLLSHDDRALFRCVAVFDGGCTLEAAEAVCGEDEPPELRDGSQTAPQSPAVLAGLSSLVTKSLLGCEEQSDGEVRFTMLRVMRAYALKRLNEAGAIASMRRRHAAYFVELAERARPHLAGPAAVIWLERLERERDNLYAALRWAAEGGDATAGLRLAGALERYWHIRGDATDARNCLEHILALTREAPPSAPQARALMSAGVLAYHTDDYRTARTLFEQSLASARKARDRYTTAAALCHLGQLGVIRHDHRTLQKAYEKALALYRELGGNPCAAEALHGLASAAYLQNDLPQAISLAQQTHAGYETAGDKDGIARALHLLGRCVLAQNERAEAEACFRDALALFREVGNRHGIAESLEALAECANQQGDYDAACAKQMEALSIARELGSRRRIARLLVSSVTLAAEKGQAARAVRLAGAAAWLLASLDDAAPPETQEELDRATERAWDALDRSDATAEYAAGHHLTVEQAIAVVLALGPALQPADDISVVQGTADLAGSAPATSPADPSADPPQALELARTGNPGGAPQLTTTVFSLPAPPPSLPVVAAAEDRAEADPRRGVLTRREREVAELIAQGLTNREIAATLIVSERTVDTHVEHILRKLCVRSRSQVAVISAGRRLAA